jgi:diadenylate cyclase
MMVEWMKVYLDDYLGDMYLPEIHLTDIVEILIIALIVYEILLWIKNTKAWMLLKGMIVLGVFILIAAIFQMHTILFLVKGSINVLAIGAVVVFQPELRRALEKLGEKNLLSNFRLFERNKENLRFTDETMHGIVKACFDMGSVCTGALIVVEQAIHLTEYEVTGIQLDCKVSSQVLINIFEHNTPLHDGAVIVRGDRITSATCYLPLSDNKKISKSLGTRHRAALGISEVSDALVIAVSEENGQVSIAMGGQLVRDVTPEYLSLRLSQIQYRNPEAKKVDTKKGQEDDGEI